MSSLPIAPDESSGEPLCHRLCQQYRHLVGGQVGCNLSIYCVDPGKTLCLPRVRELVQISRRRCDGCRHWTTHGTRTDVGWCSDGGLRDASDCCRERWEAKP